MIEENKTEESKVEQPISTPLVPPAPEKTAASSDVPAWAKELVETVGVLKAENEALKELAGKNALASLAKSKEDYTQKTAHFKKINGKIVIGWKKLDDSQFVVNLKDPHKENLFMNVEYLDGTEGRLEYIRFIRCTDLVFADLLDYNHLRFNPFKEYKVKFPNDPNVDGLNGQEVKINYKFWNA